MKWKELERDTGRIAELICMPANIADKDTQVNNGTPFES